MDLLGSGQWDLFCHHAAEMTNYRSLNFDALAAVRNNTMNARETLTCLVKRGCNRIILTGSIFEPFEGKGDQEQRAFSPYGLSKHFSFEMFRFEASRLGMLVGKFVIPNPFGPFEEPRFTSYLAREWSAGRTPTVATPVYLRDNIHVSLLAAAYVEFCQRPDPGAGVRRASPSGYVESQGSFAERCAHELGRRLGRVLPLNLARQTEFPEPLVRTNCTPAALRFPMWSEALAWDELYHFYGDRWGLRRAYDGV
jgi:nucleoside-diphosphate-sugar epimerase